MRSFFPLGGEFFEFLSVFLDSRYVPPHEEFREIDRHMIDGLCVEYPSELPLAFAMPEIVAELHISEFRGKTFDDIFFNYMFSFSYKKYYITVFQWKSSSCELFTEGLDPIIFYPFVIHDNETHIESDLFGEKLGISSSV